MLGANSNSPESIQQRICLPFRTCKKCQRMGCSGVRRPEVPRAEPRQRSSVDSHLQAFAPNLEPTAGTAAPKFLGMKPTGNPISILSLAKDSCCDLYGYIHDVYMNIENSRRKSTSDAMRRTPITLPVATDLGEVGHLAGMLGLSDEADPWLEPLAVSANGAGSGQQVAADRPPRRLPRWAWGRVSNDKYGSLSRCLPELANRTVVRANISDLWVRPEGPGP